MEEKYKCKICNKEFKTYKGLSVHLRAKIHGMDRIEVYMHHKGLTERPKCKCGCGEETTFRSYSEGGFQTFINGHNTFLDDVYRFHTEDARKKGIETQKKKWANGEYTPYFEKYTDEEKEFYRESQRQLILNQGPERGRKISEALKDKPKSEEHKRKLSEFQNLPTTWTKEKREAASLRTSKRLIESKNFKTSSIEQQIKQILIDLDFDIIHQYEINGKLYDFFLKDYNTVIEVHGNFHHANPEIYSDDYNFYQIQLDVKKNDIIKENILDEYNINLLVLWEKDIKEDLPSIIDEILEIKKGF